jgi:hypothetical protein
MFPERFFNSSRRLFAGWFSSIVPARAWNQACAVHARKNHPVEPVGIAVRNAELPEQTNRFQRIIVRLIEILIERSTSSTTKLRRWRDPSPVSVGQLMSDPGAMSPFGHYGIHTERRKSNSANSQSWLPHRQHLLSENPEKRSPITWQKALGFEQVGV